MVPPSTLLRSALLLLTAAVSTGLAWPGPHRQEPDYDVMAGQHIIYSYSGLTPPDSLLELTRQGKVLGIILFGANVGNGTPAVIESFQAAYAECPGSDGLPLLIMTDQEGGEVRRLPGGPELSAKEMGEAADPASAASTGGAQAAQAAIPYGVNVNLAPVHDVFRTAGNFIDEYQRSFGNTSGLVAECVGPFITAQQGLGVAATAKHFPGLGDANTTQDTDVEPVTIPLALDTIRSIDEVPYHTSIAAGVKLVMASWALYPALDPDFPSGLSARWIQGELRGRLGFAGVTITDALEAGALESYGATGDRAVGAARTGMDILLASSQNSTQGQVAMEAVAAALAAGELDAEAFAASTERVTALRRWLAHAK